MRKHPVALAMCAALVPLLVGFIVSLVMLALGESREVYASLSLRWLPTLIGALIFLAALPALASWWYATGAVARAKAVVAAEEAASRRRLIARLDHEIKNPVQGIRAALADEPSQRQRESIDAQSRRLSSLLSDLRKIGEVEHTELEMSQINPDRLVAEAIDTVRDVPGAVERTFTVSLPTAPRPLPAFRGDEDLLFLCLVNVLTNAVKYSKPGDAIEVRGRATDSAVMLEVADTGNGIPDNELHLVWEELGRSVEVRGIDGSGLGLPMVRAIARRHGGEATLQSWHGEGTSVTLTLPIQGPSK